MAKFLRINNEFGRDDGERYMAFFDDEEDLRPDLRTLIDPATGTLLPRVRVYALRALTATVSVDISLYPEED